MPTIISSLRHVSIHIVWTERKTNPKSEMALQCASISKTEN